MPHTRSSTRWEPQLFDDHGQPLCATQAEEDAMLTELRAAGPDEHAIWAAVTHIGDTLTTDWRLDPHDRYKQAIMWVQIAETARLTAASKLSDLTREDHLAADDIYTWVARRTTTTTTHLEATYPITQEPPF